jgi:hypothetical protein
VEGGINNKRIIMPPVFIAGSSENFIEFVGI